jgi:hypothetical protein
MPGSRLVLAKLFVAATAGYVWLALPADYFMVKVNFRLTVNQPAPYVEPHLGPVTRNYFLFDKYDSMWEPTSDVSKDVSFVRITVSRECQLSIHIQFSIYILHATSISCYNSEFIYTTPFQSKLSTADCALSVAVNATAAAYSFERS